MGGLRWETFEDVEYATLNWVSWYNTKRLHGELGYQPPVEIAEEYWDEHKLSGHAA
jgi:putative transposase